MIRRCRIAVRRALAESGRKGNPAPRQDVDAQSSEGCHRTVRSLQGRLRWTTRLASSGEKVGLQLISRLHPWREQATQARASSTSSKHEQRATGYGQRATSSKGTESQSPIRPHMKCMQQTEWTAAEKRMAGPKRKGDTGSREAVHLQTEARARDMETQTQRQRDKGAKKWCVCV